MAFTYWKFNRQNETAVFEAFFRKNPFGGEYAIFAGLNDVLEVVRDFKFSSDDINYLKTVLPDLDDDFFTFLSTIDTSQVKMWSIPEGCVIFPKVPLYIIEGPIIICQLLETIILNLTNYASLVCTNAFRHKVCAGNLKLVELGLRRAQGPNGALTASKYSYIGGFDGTSNVLAGKLFDIPLYGTMSHSFISSYFHEDVAKKINLNPQDGVIKHVDITKIKEKCQLDKTEFQNRCYKWLLFLVESYPYISLDNVRLSELLAFSEYALAFPNGFVALLDTYDTLKSGMINFCAVALALSEKGYKPIGVRIDSGDLVLQSDEIRIFTQKLSNDLKIQDFQEISVIVSNDLDEDKIHSIIKKENSINVFGVGTSLVTCQKQPALGCVYKLVSINGFGTMKISGDVEKQTLPGKKFASRLYASDGFAIADILHLENENSPKPMEENSTSQKITLIPAKVERLHELVFQNSQILINMPNVHELRKRVEDNIKIIQSDHLRFLNPLPYKVSVSKNLDDFIRETRDKSDPKNLFSCNGFDTQVV